VIEVEKKFILDEQNTKQLTLGAEFLKRITFTDVYYDSAAYALTLKDLWLRTRDGRFELKLPMHPDADRLADQYEELDDETAIRTALKLPSGGTLSDTLADAGLAPFCECVTTRTKYRREPFLIDLDDVAYPDFRYTLGEIELMVPGQSDVPAAIDQIMAFAHEQKLTIAPVRGKVIEYLRRMKPAYYQALVEAKVIQDF